MLPYYKQNKRKSPIEIWPSIELFGNAFARQDIYFNTILIVYF